MIQPEMYVVSVGSTYVYSADDARIVLTNHLGDAARFTRREAADVLRAVGTAGDPSSIPVRFWVGSVEDGFRATTLGSVHLGRPSVEVVASYEAHVRLTSRIVGEVPRERAEDYKTYSARLRAVIEANAAERGSVRGISGLNSTPGRVPDEVVAPCA